MSAQKSLLSKREEAKREESFLDFPQNDRLIGCAYTGTDSGMRLKGVIGDIDRGELGATFYNDQCEVAFTVTFYRAQWHMNGDDLLIHIFDVGLFTIKSTRP